jgi:hypothetical protein
MFRRSCVRRVNGIVNFERRMSWAVAFMFQMLYAPLPPPELGDRLGPKPGQFAEEKRKIANLFSLALGRYLRLLMDTSPIPCVRD